MSPDYSEAREEALLSKGFDEAKDGLGVEGAPFSPSARQLEEPTPRELAMRWAMRCWGEMERAS